MTVLVGYYSFFDQNGCHLFKDNENKNAKLGMQMTFLESYINLRQVIYAYWRGYTLTHKQTGKEIQTQIVNSVYFNPNDYNTFCQ